MLNAIIFIQGVTIAIFAIIIVSQRKRSHDGLIVITRDEEGKKLFSLELDKEPDDIEQMRYVVFKVTDEPTEDLD